MKTIFSNQRGFTFIELLAVIVILMLLGGIVGKNIMGQLAKSKHNTAKIQIKGLEGAMKMFKLDNGYYPTTDEGLEALVTQPAEAKNWVEGGYLDNGKVPLDPWGNPYIYISPGNFNHYDIISLGADSNEGGDGENADINSWEIE